MNVESTSPSAKGTNFSIRMKKVEETLREMTVFHTTVDTLYFNNKSRYLGCNKVF